MNVTLTTQLPPGVSVSLSPGAAGQLLESAWNGPRAARRSAWSTALPALRTVRSCGSLRVPTFCGLNSIPPSSKLTAGARRLAPPSSGRLRVPPSLAMSNAPSALPVASGVNVTWTAQLSPGSSVTASPGSARQSSAAV